jgi:hypothetical protein
VSFQKQSTSSQTEIRYIVIKFKENLGLPYSDNFEKHLKGLGLDELADIFSTYDGLKLLPLITSLSVEQLTKLEREAESLDPDYKPSNFRLWYRIAVSPRYQLSDIVEQLRSINYLEYAYAEPKRSLASFSCAIHPVNDPLAVNELYLGPSPVGIDACYAWGQGADGTGIQLLDIERDWTINHVDLPPSVRTALVYGSRTGIFSDMGHGTSVLATIAGIHNNGSCGAGISPNCSIKLISSNPNGEADAIIHALPSLAFGDVLLLPEISGDLPLEADPAVFQAIRTAAAKAVVIEPAGHNFRNLDLTPDYAGVYIWDKFNRHPPPHLYEYSDSGAIIVGAANSQTRDPTSPTHSNYGSRINCYAWGDSIQTAGGGPAPNDFTTTFGGTCGAASIIAGAALCVQSAAARSGFRYSPSQMRELLSSSLNGTPAVAVLEPAPSTQVRNVGYMPDLKKF